MGNNSKSGQSVVLWSRLHLVTNSRRVLRWTLYMIIIDGMLLHSITSVLTFGANSSHLPAGVLEHFVHGYSVMEKVQMVGFFTQELVLSGIYIRETIRLLKLSESTQDDVKHSDHRWRRKHLRSPKVRKIMYQLLAINVIIIMMDLALLGVEFANLYVIETTFKGVVYSIKLKLEYAVLGKLVQLVHTRTSSNGNSDPSQQPSIEHHTYPTSLALEKTSPEESDQADAKVCSNSLVDTHQHYPDFVDPTRLSADLRHADPVQREDDWSTRDAEEGDGGRRRTRTNRASWIDEEMDKHNIV